MERIAEKYFSKLSGPPKADSLEYENGNDYDHVIRGWTKYWNEVLNPTEPLDPDFVKVLIATESSFKVGKAPKAGKKAGRARGLMQVTDWTLKTLADNGGELKDHYVHVSQDDMKDPVLNIAAGIRWLFRKKEIAQSKLGRKATWRDAVVEYKSYTKDPYGEQMRKFDALYKRIKQK